MLSVPKPSARIYVRPGPTDLRKQINGLAVLVEQEMELSPFEEALFLFCNRQRRLLKAIWWDRTGFCLWMKRLEKGQFPWPRTAEETSRVITADQLHLLLVGIDLFAAHQPLSYERMS